MFGRVCTSPPGADLKREIDVDLLDICGELYVEEASKFSLSVNGVPISYDVEEGILSCLDKRAPLKADDGKIILRILVDKTSIEIFGNNGRILLPVGVVIDGPNVVLEAHSEGGRTTIDHLEVHELASIW